MADMSLKRIGVLGVERGTSHISGQWAPAMNPLHGAGRRTGMVITHAWDKERSIAEAFAKRYNVPNVVDRYDDMVGKVDGVVQSGYKASFWSFELTKPYIETGAAVFIDRPGAYSIATAKQMLTLARKHNSLVYWGNNHESHVAVELMQERMKLASPLAGIVADSLADPEPRFYSMHCLHGVYMLYPLIAGTIRRVRTYVAEETVFAPVMLVECENPDGSPFLVTLQRHGVDNVSHEGLRPLPQPRESATHRGYFRILGRNGTYADTLQAPMTYDRSVPDRDRRGSDRYHRLFTFPAMEKLDGMLASGQLPVPEEQLIEKLRLFLASWKSLLEGGRAIEIDSLPEEWTGPNPYPGYFPEGYFADA